MSNNESSFQNPIVEVYRGFNIRKYTKIQIRLNITEARKVIDAKLDYEMSAKDAILNKKILCGPSPGVLIMSLKK